MPFSFCQAPGPGQGPEPSQAQYSTIIDSSVERDIARVRHIKL